MPRNKFGDERPDEDEVRSTRLQVLVTESEAAAIDNWGAGNKLKSKAEMVRQLFKIGLEAADKADTLEEQKLHLLNLKRRAAREITGVNARLRTTQTEEERTQILRRGLELMGDILMELILATADISTTATRIVAPAISRRSNPEVETALYAAGWTTAQGLDEASEQDMRERLRALQTLADRQSDLGEDDK
ncbi:hypothetical protein PMI07_002389 [Rhizobium sp. CF080]|nr:hypothetical protein PMI07_002389 [Rhizobium sp. CF080]